MRPRITVYLSDAQLEYLRREAAKQRRSLSSYVTDCVIGYHVDRETGSASQASSPPFTALLRDTEDRVASPIQRSAAFTSKQLLKHLTLLSAMLDRFVLSTLVNTPEVSESHRANAISSGERRYRNWREAVKEMLDQVGIAHPESWPDDQTEQREEDAA